MAVQQQQGGVLFKDSACKKVNFPASVACVGNKF